MRTLLIAPASNLDNLTEVIQAIGAGSADILHGLVTGREVIARIEGGEYGRIMYSGHSNAGAWELSDGLLSYEQIGMVALYAKVELIFVNGCQGVESLNELHDMGIPYCIGWAHDVMDDVAQLFAATFWRTLRVNNNDYKTAFLKGRRAVRSLFPSSLAPILFNGQAVGLQVQVDALIRQMQERSFLDRRRMETWMLLIGAALVITNLIQVVLLMMH